MKILHSFISFLILLGVSSLHSQEPVKTLTLDDIYRGNRFSARTVRGLESLNDGQHYTLLERDSINTYRFDNGQRVATMFAPGLIKLPDGKKPSIDSYQFSANEQRILLSADTEPIYRYSRQSTNYVFDIRSGRIYDVSPNGKQRLAELSPDGSKVAFVRGNNLFISFLDEGRELQITFDGLERQFINGTTDWVYEEEFGITKGFQWSPDGSHIAYLRFDESHVREFFLTTYGSLYPGQHRYKYPKAGEANSIVTLQVYNLATGNTSRIDTGPETDQYIPRFQWTRNPGVLSFQRLNRHQNHLEILLADISTRQIRLLYEEKDKYYISITHDLTFLDDGKHFIITSERDGYNHIYLCDIYGRLVKKLTQGPWEVTALLGVDQKNSYVYYQAAKQSPLYREVYRVGFNGRGDVPITNALGTSTMRFSKTFDYAVLNFSTANTPPRTSVVKGNGLLVRHLQQNEQLSTLAKEYRLSKMEFFTITNSEGAILNASMLKPYDFDASKKYPVLMYVYGGPGSQTVRDAWGGATNLWFHLLTQKGYIVVAVDNRGTGYRGAEFKKMTYLQLGKYETIDQIEAAQHLASLPYVDGNRIGVYGWSYGGYMALLCMTKGAEVFRAGIAVAPVSNWKHYDNIYTERYMRTPAENPEGYEQNSPVNHAANLKGKLLIAHGTGDDNVHIENSIDMIDALIANNVQYNMLFYPNRDHGINSGNARIHLFTALTSFILTEL